MNLRDAAYNLVADYPGGAASLGPRMKKSGTTLSHEVKGQGSAKLGLLDAEKLTDLADNDIILSTWAGNRGYCLMRLPVVHMRADDDCMLRLADSAREFGDLCKEVAGDLADGKITDNELARIDRECGQLIASVYAMREAVARRNVEGKPSSELGSGL